MGCDLIKYNLIQHILSLILFSGAEKPGDRNKLLVHAEIKSEIEPELYECKYLNDRFNEKEQNIAHNSETEVIHEIPNIDQHVFINHICMIIQKNSR